MKFFKMRIQNLHTGIVEEIIIRANSKSEAKNQATKIFMANSLACKILEASKDKNATEEQAQRSIANLVYRNY